jgi:hypothetical protein
MNQIECTAWQRFYDITGIAHTNEADECDRLDPCACNWWSDCDVNDDIDLCVVCKSDHITTIRLFDLGLNGSIPSEIGLFSSLTALHLGWNELKGSIPPNIGSLSALTYLALNRNHIGGSIPSQIKSLSALKYFDMYHNRLSGVIPPLPFAQYTAGCCLNVSGVDPEGNHDHPEHNHFSCPLPPGAATCNHRSGGKLSPVLTCTKGGE